MRILYGGTFDPVHRGHIAIAQAVASALGSPVNLVPAADPPHRTRPGARADQRAAMLDLAVACHPQQLLVDRRELDRGGPSFTVDTLEEVRRQLGPSIAIVWVLGIDSLAQLSTWHEWRRIFDLAHILGVQRPGTSLQMDWVKQQAPAVHAEIEARKCALAALGDAAAGSYAALPMHPLRTESASEVRLRIANGQSWDELVPTAVARYIRDTGLYTADRQT